MAASLPASELFGAEKSQQRCLPLKPEALAQYHATRASFDPLNPGTAVPAPACCIEPGPIHVHGGRTKLPELERFRWRTPT